MKTHCGGDNTDQGKKGEWTPTTVGGSVNSWLLIRKSVASSSMGGYSATMAQCWPYEMKKDEERRMEVRQQKLVSRLGRSAAGGTGLFAQNHQTNGAERRSADSEEGRRRCQAVGEM